MLGRSAGKQSTGLFSDPPHPGQWFQSESGLYQNLMRDYDPTTGRYLQADPLGLVDGASVYGYAMQSPIIYTDFTGLTVQILIGGRICNMIEKCVAYWSDNDFLYKGR
ncbi:MAG: RHS repeat-associated core domain-containing protein [Microgenomates group bacterium]